MRLQPSAAGLVRNRMQPPRRWTPAWQTWATPNNISMDQLPGLDVDRAQSLLAEHQDKERRKGASYRHKFYLTC